MIVGNKCAEKATGSIIVLILTDERECCRWEGPLIARVIAGLAWAGWAEQSNKSSHCKFIRPD